MVSTEPLRPQESVCSQSKIFMSKKKKLSETHMQIPLSTVKNVENKLSRKDGEEILGKVLMS